MTCRSAVPLLMAITAVGLLAVLTYALLRPDGSSAGASLDAKVERGQTAPAVDPDRAMPSLTAQGSRRLADYRGRSRS